jgi:hypothetical protein
MAAFAHAPEDFQELDGEVVEGTSQSNQFQLAQWIHNGESEQVVIEYHDYAHGLLQEDLEENEVLELKQPVRDLVWLLQNSAFTVRGEEPDQSNQPTIYSLQCLGYKDEVDKHRFTFFYQLPPVSSDVENKLLTLHELINQLDDKTRQPLKPSLGSRFSIAYCLALSLLNIHGSSWLHKNIWSRGILLFQKGDNGIEPFETKPTGTNKTCLGFLGDWGYARPIGATRKCAVISISNLISIYIQNARGLQGVNSLEDTIFTHWGWCYLRSAYGGLPRSFLGVRSRMLNELGNCLSQKTCTQLCLASQKCSLARRWVSLLWTTSSVTCINESTRISNILLTRQEQSEP